MAALYHAQNLKLYSRFVIADLSKFINAQCRTWVLKNRPDSFPAQMMSELCKAGISIVVTRHEEERWKQIVVSRGSVVEDFRLHRMHELSVSLSHGFTVQEQLKKLRALLEGTFGTQGFDFSQWI